MQNLIEEKQKFLRNRKQAYLLTFLEESEAVREVLADLKTFCRAETSTFHADPRVHALLEGRREVYQRIKNHLELSLDELWSQLSKGE